MRKHDRQNIQHVTQWFRYVLAWYLHAHIYIPLMESQWVCKEDFEDIGTNPICQTAHGLYTYAQTSHTSPKNTKILNLCAVNPYHELIEQCFQFWQEYTYDKNNDKNTLKIVLDQFPFSIEDDPVKTIYEKALVYFRTHIDQLHFPKDIAPLFESSPIERSFASALKLVALFS